MATIAGGILLAVFALYVIAWLIGHSDGGARVVTRRELEAQLVAAEKWAHDSMQPGYYDMPADEYFKPVSPIRAGRAVNNLK